MQNEQVRQHVLFTEHHKVKEICQPLSTINIDGFFYMRRFNDASFVDLSTNLVWSEFFLNKFLNNQYPSNSIEDHMFMEDGVSLWALNPHNIIWQEGKAQYGYSNGISICDAKKNYHDIFCFYSKNDDNQMNRFYLNNIIYLKKFGQFFLEEASSIINKGIENRIMAAHCQPQHQLQLEDNLLQFVEHLNSNFFNLSKRELDCIQLIIKGHSAKEVGEKLFISKRTVETHLNNARKKCHCKNVVELIFKMAKCNFI